MSGFTSVGHSGHSCKRDTLPEFMGRSGYLENGEVVQCDDCGQHWLVLTAEFTDRIEVPDDWTWDGTLTSLLEFTDLPYDSGDLLDYEVNP